jgi:hypothetical protein
MTELFSTFKEKKRLEENLKRILENKKANLILSISIYEEGAEIHENEEEEIVFHEETEFVKKVKKFIEEKSSKYKIDSHLHSHSGSLTIGMETYYNEVLDNIIQIINEIQGIENVLISAINGEIWRNNDLVAFLYGDSVKNTFVLPSHDGKKLELIEVAMTIS